MTEFISGIDHPVLAVADMAAARHTYERLGFTIPPRGKHLEWGTGNWCIMFPHDYLELRGIIDPEKYTHNLGPFLEMGEGVMGIALGTPDAQFAHDCLRERGFDPQPVKSLTRNFELPTGIVQPRFQLCFLPESETGGLMSVVFCQHLTPELLRKPEWLDHPNGAHGVLSVTCVVADLDKARETHQRLFGIPAISDCGDSITIQVAGRRKLHILTRETFHKAYAELADAPWPRDEFIAAVSLVVSDLDASANYLGNNDILCTHLETKIRIAPSEVCGVILEFESQ